MFLGVCWREIEKLADVEDEILHNLLLSSTATRVQSSASIVSVGQKHLIVSVHLQLAAQRRYLVGASLMESVIALIAVEPSEQKSPAALAESEREECLANELM